MQAISFFVPQVKCPSLQTDLNHTYTVHSTCAESAKCGVQESHTNISADTGEKVLCCHSKVPFVTDRNQTEIVGGAAWQEQDE